MILIVSPFFLLEAKNQPRMRTTTMTGARRKRKLRKRAGKLAYLRRLA
jgi:hypothetical protein